MLTSSSRIDDTVDPLDSKIVGHHRAQQSMDNSTMPFKVSETRLTLQFVFKSCYVVIQRLIDTTILSRSRKVA